MTRRTVLGLLAGLTMLATATASSAQPAPARKAPVPAAKLFPYLDRYLKLPPAERTMFGIAYVVTRDGAPARGLKMWLINGASREPIPVGTEGRVERLPTLTQLRTAKVEIEAPADAKFGMRLLPIATLSSAAELSAADLARAVRQADAGAHKAAGLLGLAVPKFDRVSFPGAGGGQAVARDGGVTPLPSRRSPYADLALLGKAEKIRFERPPATILITPAPKS